MTHFIRSVFGAGLVVGALAIASTSGVADAAPAVDRPLQICNNSGDYAAQAILHTGQATKAITTGCSQINAAVGAGFDVKLSKDGREKTLTGGAEGYKVYAEGSQLVVCGNFDTANAIEWKYGGDPRC
ncbi:hypothetical protein GCM10022222_17150 [Amycolatopsis ultiminotia]|uniref:Secreted protein n=1 Tax=Amycolatopsis ultiminotia TaxID=543629 RepID=A0ABP6VEB4_9PSEU